MKPMKLAAFVALSLTLGAQAFAMEHSKKDIKLLKDSAAALAVSDPDLSTRLKQYANQEADESKATESSRAATEEKQDLQVVRDAAAALKTTRPELSKGLDKFAAKEDREMKRGSSERTMMPPAQPAPTTTPGY